MAALPTAVFLVLLLATCVALQDCGRKLSVTIGGREATEGADWPSMGLLGRRKNGTFNWYCNGKLLNNRWVVTAVDCLDIGRPDVIRLGERTKHRDDDDDFNVDFSIRRIVLHPDFRHGGVVTPNHGLALIELSQDVESRVGISPVCLPWAEAALQTLHNETVNIIGWEATEFVIVSTSLPDSPNEDCTIAASGNRGWCRFLIDCLSVLPDETDSGVNYTLCGVGSPLGRLAVVCCPVPLDCGRKLSDIIDVHKATEGAGSAWPWMGLLGRRKNGTVNWYCHGTLVNNRWVLTATHCLDFGRPDVIRLGEQTKHRDDDDDFHVDFSIRRIVLHPDFRHGGVYTAYHDLALIELSQAVKPGVGISPVCLPWAEAAQQTLHYETVPIAGFGATEFGGKPTDRMREGKVTVFPSEICDAAYQLLPSYTFKWPQSITEETFLCAGGGSDACKGDSGGPLVHEDKATSRFVLRGIVAVGYGCGLGSFPGLYVPVAKPRYLAWIKEVAFSNM